MTTRRNDPTRPFDMAAGHWTRLLRLSEDARARVLERASILHEACPGITWERADELALAYETCIGAQTRMVGT